MAKWVKILIALLLALFRELEDPKTRRALLRAIGAVKGTPDPNAKKAALNFREAVDASKIPKEKAGPVWKALLEGGASEPDSGEGREEEEGASEPDSGEGREEEGEAT